MRPSASGNPRMMPAVCATSVISTTRIAGQMYEVLNRILKKNCESKSRNTRESVPSPPRGEGQGEGLKRLLPQSPLPLGERAALVPSPLRGEGQGEGLKRL